MTTILIDRIKQRLTVLGLSARKASLEAFDNPETLRAILDGRTTSPRMDTLAKLASALQTSVEWLSGASDDAISRTTQAEVRAANVEAPLVTTMLKDVPVMGTAAGSHSRGAFQFEGGIIDYVRRPPSLTGTRDIYALFIEGTSVEPRYRPGDLVFVHPHKPPRLGDFVIVQIRNGEHSPIEASIGEYLKRTTDQVIIGKLNPAANIAFPRDKVVAIHKVLETNELFGI